MKFNLGCLLAYDILQPSTLIFNIRPYNNNHQKIEQETLEITPQIEIEANSSQPDKENRYFRVNANPGKLEINYRATVESFPLHKEASNIIEIPPAELPLKILPYVLPSRYCQSDQLIQLADSEFGTLLPGYSRVQGICNWIYEKVTYLAGSTNSQTSAYDTAIERAGVCRDFAHLGIAFCRAMNIPARFVGGYAYGLTPPDFHAFFEAYLNNEWYLFDATRLVPLTATIRIGTGRDATDVSFATIFGSVQMQQMKVFIEPVSEQNTTPPQTFMPTTDAIATC
ncbi:transglutaminase family protein [Ancylothrix sp. C2]|uniref:transglutaminase-like domain-containing protein n=1 Tax=Ancylothrix sp. D3o TaxID=2953691 RepID=UPI0021BB87BD|nr:transglutaminase family protein [Ancylothrix sp. D3o]MCT7949660.1 transglutaminase family protein [Ancylothrix sp. D3o]